MDSHPAERIIRFPELKHMTGECRTVIYGKIKINRFPRQKKLGTKSVGWSFLQVQDYIRITLAGGDYIAPAE